MRTPRERIDAYRRAYEAQSTEDRIRAIDAARFACFERAHTVLSSDARPDAPSTAFPNIHGGAYALYLAVSELWRWACIEAIFGRAQ